MRPSHDPIPQLPAEIWLMILEHLPPSFFQQDVRRLTLSRRWYSLAFPAFYPRVEYTPRVISRLVHRKSKSLDRSRSLLRKSLRCINIVLEGFCTSPPGTAPVATAAASASGRGANGANGSDPDTACFNTASNLARFCRLLLDFRELQAVRFVASWENRAWPADPLRARGYLPLRSVEPYLGLLTKHVTSMDLDLCGTDVVNDAGTHVHFCSYVGPLLSKLKTLRLRMRTICHVALWPVGDAPVTLGALTLSVYLGRVSENNPKLNSSKSCTSPSAWEWISPMDELRTRMNGLVKDMAEPKRAELVHLAPSGEVHVWNAATGVCLRDGSEKPRVFPLCFEESARKTCFSEIEDEWDWDDEMDTSDNTP